MTEQEWLECADPQLMLIFLENNATERKLRLFCCSCVRRVWNQLTSAADSREAVKVAEQFADGRKERSDLAEYRANADDVINVKCTWGRKNARRAAAWCAADHVNASSTARSVSAGASLARRTRDKEFFGQAHLLRCIFGNPFRPVTVSPSWQTANVIALAQAIYDDRAFDRLPILADALEDAGCDNADILNHCRGPGPHVRGCWPLDLVLGKS